MRELIDVNFIDKTNYAEKASGDAGGILLSHHWGPVGRLNRLSLSDFLRFYPTSTKRLHSSWINAYRAFQSGLGVVDVFRVQGGNMYKYFVIPAEDSSPEVVEAADTKLIAAPSIGLRFAGVPAQMVDGQSLIVRCTDISDEEGFNDEGFPPAVRIELFSVPSLEGTFELAVLDPTDNNVYSLMQGGVVLGVTDVVDLSNYTPIEVYEGFTQIGFQLDGQNAFIGSKIQSQSHFLQFINNASTSFLAANYAVAFTFDPLTAPTDVDADTLAGMYPDVFADIEVAKSTILIDPGTTSNDAANNFLKAASAQARADLVAVCGYPTGNEFNKDSILAYRQSLSPAQFGGFYATRELVTINSVNYTSNGAGTIAGRIAGVAASANVNQLPSAKTWGVFGGVILESLSFKDVLSLHEKGVNSVYASVDGARIFGLRSLHARAMSYYSKFNVSRVAARILRYGFSVALNALHVGNTGALKASVQNLLDADLTRLKATGDIRSQSNVLCADSNNQDIDTMGGEILIIDYEIWFVKLVERVKFTITATDNSISVSQS